MFDGKYIEQISYVFLVLLFLASIINIIVIYAKYIIIIENKEVFESLAKSMKLSIATFATTVKLYLLMFILNTRVIINFIIFLAFPVTIITLITLITSKIFLTITIVLLSIIFLLFILFLGYLTGTLEVFKTAIWFFAYKNATIKLKKLDQELN
jgi:hypothetical protein